MNTGHVFDLGKDADAARPGLLQCTAQGEQVGGAPHKGQHYAGDAALHCDVQVLQIFFRQGRRRNLQPRSRNAFAAEQHSAPHHSALQCVGHGRCYPHQQFAVVQQKLLPGLCRLHQSLRAGNAALPQPHGVAGSQSHRLRQSADAQFRPLQVDEQIPDAGFTDQREPVGVGRKRPVRKIHTDAGHTGVHHPPQDVRLRAGRADGTIKIQNGFPRFCFLPIVA